MRYSFLLLVLFLFSNQLKGQLRFANECSKLKTKTEGTPAASDGGQQGSICDWAATAYQNCLCEVEKHNEKLYTQRAIAQEEFKAIVDRNKAKFKKAELLRSQADELRYSLNDIQQGKDYYHRTETTLTASYTDFKGIFNSRKESAIRKLYEANRILNTFESTYKACTAINMGISENCKDSNPYTSTIDVNKNTIKDLFNASYSPGPINIVVNSDSDPYSNVRGNGPTNDIKKEYSEKSTFSPEMSRLQGDYTTLRNEQKAMLNRTDLTDEQRGKLLDYYTQQKINKGKEMRRQYQKEQYENRPQGAVSLFDYNSIGVGMDYNATASTYSSQIAAQKIASNAKYQRNVATITAVANLVEAGISFFQEQRRRRLERDRIAMEKQKIEDKKIKLFFEQAMSNRKEYRKIIAGRQDFFHGIELNPTNKLKGNTLKPIYIFYAYAKKNYKQFSENIEYPNKMKFSINENAIISFSTVYGIFPQRNLQYPLTQTIKNNILDNYFEHDQNDYDIVFFQWSGDLDEIIEELKKQLKLSVEKHYFYKSVPSTSYEIIFINNKITKSDEIDYWNEND